MSALSSSAAENCGSATPKCWQSKLKRNVKMSSTVSFYCKVRHIDEKYPCTTAYFNFDLHPVLIVNIKGRPTFWQYTKNTALPSESYTPLSFNHPSIVFLPCEASAKFISSGYGSSLYFFFSGCRTRFSRLAASLLDAHARALPSLNLRKKRDRSQSSQNCLNCQNVSLPTKVTFPTVY